MEERSLWLWAAGSPGLLSLLQRAVCADTSMERAVYGSGPGKDELCVISAGKCLGLSLDPSADKTPLPEMGAKPTSWILRKAWLAVV